ncbi:YciI family protein [Paenibacillus sp. NRS-1760]|uniref:YciI family protein n=1 Tax=Paenibacillus sp. NRS-1760 TaxID=3233902 RepID=UPI003D27AD3A
MRYMLIVKATKQSEAGVKPDRQLMDEMASFNDSLAEAGVLLAAEGLQPSSSGLRITYSEYGEKPNVVVGPFAEVKGIIAGYTLIDVKSEEEAIAFAMLMPNPAYGGEGEIELRLLLEDTKLLQGSRMMALEADLRDQIDILNKS